MTNEKCATCKFWRTSKAKEGDRIDYKVGTCNRYPPKLFVDSKGVDQLSPRTVGAFYCGEYQPKPEDTK